MTLQNLLFKDSAIGDAFLRDGFVVLEGALSGSMDEFCRIVSRQSPAVTDSFFYSLLSYEYDVNIQIRHAIMGALQPFYREYFTDYCSRNESFLIKPAQTQEELLLHQDWSYTDITQYVTGTLWAPLTNTNTNNGALFFLKQSHLKFTNYVSSTLPTLRIHSNLFDPKHIHTVLTQPGDVVLFNPMLFHGSYPNHSTQHRTVITANLFHPKAPYCLPHILDNEPLLSVTLHDDDFLKSLSDFATGKIDLSGRKTEPLATPKRVILENVLRSYIS